MVFLVLDKRWSLAGQLLQHSGHGSGADVQMASQGIAGYSLFVRTAQLEDRLEVIIDGLGRGWKPCLAFTKTMINRWNRSVCKACTGGGRCRRMAAGRAAWAELARSCGLGVG